MRKILTKAELSGLLKSLSKDFEIIGPKEVENKGIFYQPIAGAEELYMGGLFATEPAKKFFLEPSEWLFQCEYKEGKDSAKDALPDRKKRIIIGIRPCEARGLTLLDKIFDSDYKDRTYVDNRARTVIIGLACSSPDESCFCASLDGSPVDTRGMDAILYEAGDKFVVDAITDKAGEIFGALGKELDDGEKKALELAGEKSKKMARAAIKTPEELESVFESDYWREASISCLSCGVCTYLCPTCHCFDLVDEERKRLRCYDGCAFSHFTLETSGENPRPTKKERYRQRVFHKFCYFKKNFGENLCVGCGRCIRYCPVKIDIRAIVASSPSGGG